MLALGLWSGLEAYGVSLPVTLIFSTVLAIVTVMWFWWRKWDSWTGRFIFKKPLGRGIWLHPLLMLIASSALPLIEGKGSDFGTFSKVFVRMFLLFVPSFGWEAGGPRTEAGIFIASLLTIFLLANGVINFGSALWPTVNKFLKGRRKMDFENHIIVWGGTEHLGDILEQLTNEALGRKRAPIVFIIEESLHQEVTNIVDNYKSKWNKIEVIEGSAQHEEVLNKANILRAKAILLFPPERKIEPKPELSLLSAASKVRDMLNRANPPKKPAVIARVESPLLVEPIRKFADKVICASQREYLLASEAAIFPQIIDVYNDLMTISKESNEFYTEEIPECWVGKSYTDFASSILAKTRDSTNPATVVGVVRDNQVFLNPCKEKVDLLDKGDEIIIIAYECIDSESIF